MFDPGELIVSGPRRRGYAIGDFLCPGCGGIADVIVAELPLSEWAPRQQHPAAPTAIAWYAPWRAYVTVELVCQGPADPDAPDPEWDHAGECIDLLATGYQPISLS